MTKLFKCDGCGQTGSGESVAVYAYSTREDGTRIVRTADMHLVCFSSLRLLSKTSKDGLMEEHVYNIEWTEKAVKKRERLT